MSEHGIIIRKKATREVVHFIPCGFGPQALRVLSGVRHNLSRECIAEEGCLKKEEIPHD